MKLYFASDHAGFELKGKLFEYAKGLGYDAIDLGPSSFDPDDDYPEYVSRASEMVSRDPQNSMAVILGSSGQGEDMVAGKYPNVRSAEFYGGPLEVIELSRKHNDANILSLGAKFINDIEAKKAMKLWLEIPFSNEERHRRRIQQIEDLEETLYKKP